MCTIASSKYLNKCGLYPGVIIKKFHYNCDNLFWFCYIILKFCSKSISNPNFMILVGFFFNLEIYKFVSY